MTIQSLHLVADVNGDGSYSLGEIHEAIGFVYHLPGNLLVEGLGHVPYVASLLGIQASAATGYGSLDSLFADTLSLLFWVAILFTVLTLSSPTVDEPEQAARHTREARPAELGHHAPDHATHVARSHLPVSRPAYAAPGIQQHRRHRLSEIPARHGR